MKTRISATIILSASIFSAPLAAQTGSGDARWSVDVQGGAAFPTSEIEGDGLGTGLGFEANAAYRFARHVSVYAGWDWHRFTPDALLGETGVDLEETGYVFGLRFEHPFSGERGSGPSYRLRAAMTVNHIELEDSDGSIISDSGHGVGFEVGAGVLFPLGDNWRVGPETRFRSLGRTLDIGENGVEVDLRYLTLDLVLSRSF